MKAATTVLHILPRLSCGGAEWMAVNLMANLDRKRFNISVLSLAGPMGSVLETTLAANAVPMYYLGKHPGFDPRMFARVDRFLREFRPDVLHTHVHVLRYTLPSMLYRRPAAMLHTVHNIAEMEVERRAWWIQRLAFKNGVVPVACAHEVAASLKRLYGIKDSLVVPNSVSVRDVRDIKVPREQWRKREKIPRDSFVFACVARFDPQKNHKLLMDAFARGPAKNPRVRLVLAGRGGELQTQVEHHARQLGCADRIHFLGLRPDIADLLGACDAFVLSSDFEGSPLAVMEAMAAGLPIISTSVGGVPELIEDGREGTLIPPMNSEALAFAMVQFSEHPDSIKAMGNNAAVKALNQFDTPMMVAAYERIYYDLLGCAVPRPKRQRAYA